MIHNIVSDLGNVLLRYEPLKFLQNKYDMKKAEKLYKYIFLSQEWLDLDRGVINYDEAIDIISGRYPEYHDSIKYLINNWIQLLSPIEGSIELLESLKEKGYKIYLLSNWHKQSFEVVYKKYNLLKNFDGMVISSDVYLLKPEPQIFINLCSKYEIKPEESVFIDDMVLNVDVAKELGFKGIQFFSPEQLKAGLIQLGINNSI